MRERIRRFKSSSLRQQKRNDFYRFFFVYVSNFEEDLRVGAVLREQNALPVSVYATKSSTAKDAIDNGGAGRDAKGANPLLCAKIKGNDFYRFFFCLCIEFAKRKAWIFHAFPFYS